MTRFIILALAPSLLLLAGCGTYTRTTTVRDASGERTVKDNAGPYSSDHSEVIVTDKAFRECRAYNAPTMGSSQADAYCRNVTSGGRAFVPGYSGSMGYGPASYVMPAPLGSNEYSGSFLVVGEADPTQAGYARYSQAAPPLVTRDEYQKDMGTVAKRVHKNTRAIGCLTARRGGACPAPQGGNANDKKPEATAADETPSK